MIGFIGKFKYDFFINRLMRKEVLVVLLLLVMPIMAIISEVASSNPANDTHYLITDSKHLKVVEVDSSGNLIWEYGCTGSQCFCEKDNCFYGFDSGTRLSNGNTLIVDNVHNKILEVDVDGNTIWRYGDGKVGSYFNQLDHPKTAFRLGNGNTLIADNENNRVIEVESGKSTTWEYGCDNKFLDCSANTISENLKSPSSATMTKEGKVLIADTDNNRVIEVNKNNEIQWGFGCTAYDLANKCGASDYNLLKPSFAIRLENSTLITDSGNNRIIEVSLAGEIIWRYGSVLGKDFNQLNNPKSAIMLKNGNVLIADSGNNRVIEVEKKSREIVFKYANVLSPSYAEVALINYKRVRTSAPGCLQKENGFQVEFESTIQPKYTYVIRKDSDKRIYLSGKYDAGKFTSTDTKITESGQYNFYAAYDEETSNYSMYCKLDKLICNAINLSINDCYLEDGMLNVSITGLGEQYKFINFNNMFLDIHAEEKIWDELTTRSCGEKPKLDIQRFGMGTRISKSGNDSYSIIAPIGKYNVRMVNLMLGECCQEDSNNAMVYPKTKTLAECRVITKCVDNSDCNDGNDATTDLCNIGTCTNEKKNLNCVEDTDCNDYASCTRDVCVLGKCSYTSTCSGCNYCSNDGRGCVTNETCLLILEEENQNSNSLVGGDLKNIVGSRKDDSLLWQIVFLLAFAITSSAAVYFIMKKKLDAEIEKEKKLVAEKGQKSSPNMGVVHNMTPEQAKAIQDIVGDKKETVLTADSAESTDSAKNTYVKQTVDPTKVAAVSAATEEQSQKHVRQAFPGTALPGNANPAKTTAPTTEPAIITNPIVSAEKEQITTKTVPAESTVKEDNSADSAKSKSAEVKVEEPGLKSAGEDKPVSTEIKSEVSTPITPTTTPADKPGDNQPSAGGVKSENVTKTPDASSSADKQ